MKKIILLPILLALALLAGAQERRNATSSELASLVGVYDAPDRVYPPGTGTIRLSTGVFRSFTGSVVLDPVALGQSRPRFLNWQSAWTGMITGAVKKTVEGYEFFVIADLAEGPAVLTVQVKVVGENRYRFFILRYDGTVYDATLPFQRQSPVSQ